MKIKIIVITFTSVLLCASFVCWQSRKLNIAHSTFENYAEFRGCISILNKTTTSADCILQSGDRIKLVEIGSRWYLEGDGPGIW